MSFACREQAAFECDFEGAERGLPAVHSPPPTTSGRIEAAHDLLDALQRGLVVGEVCSCSGRGACPSAG